MYQIESLTLSSKGLFHQRFTKSFYACGSPKRKNDSQVINHFALLGFTSIKALHTYVGEIDPKKTMKNAYQKKRKIGGENTQGGLQVGDGGASYKNDKLKVRKPGKYILHIHLRNLQTHFLDLYLSHTQTHKHIKQNNKLFEMDFINYRFFLLVHPLGFDFSSVSSKNILPKIEHYPIISCQYFDVIKIMFCTPVNCNFRIILTPLTLNM